MMIRKLKRGFSLLLVMILLAGCGGENRKEHTVLAPPDSPGNEEVANLEPENALKEEVEDGEVEEKERKPQMSPTEVVLKPYDNIHQLFYSSDDEYVFEPHQYSPDEIHTYGYDDHTVFKGSEELALEILEAGKNPGLGIKSLHQQGITGKGVNVAIIDQNMLTTHPEFEGRIVAYFDSGCEEPEDEGSYHGASVTSILAGKTIGVAPEVNVYYAAAPSWKMDASYFAKCLEWITVQNRRLPEDKKIRVVSVSAAPTSANNWYTNGHLWEEAVLAAEKEGIMVIDCRSEAETGFVFSSYFDFEDREDVTKSKPGYPGKYIIDPTHEGLKKYLLAPASYRTLAQERKSGEIRYRYEGVGGQSWAVPYVAGVLALGWQVNPDLDGKTMKELLYTTSWVNDQGMHFLDPITFIEAVKVLKR